MSPRSRVRSATGGRRRSRGSKALRFVAVCAVVAQVVAPAAIIGNLLGTAPAGAVSQPSVIGDVYSIVGTGAAGDSGHNGQATMAQMDNPTGVVTDAAGNVYFSDNANGEVMELAATTHSQWGIAMTAGDVYVLPCSSCTDPTGLALDASGDLYVANRSGNVVYELAATEAYVTKNSTFEYTAPIDLENIVTGAERRLTFFVIRTGTVTASTIITAYARKRKKQSTRLSAIIINQ
jgi:hypothetical protein